MSTTTYKIHYIESNRDKELVATKHTYLKGNIVEIYNSQTLVAIVNLRTVWLEVKRYNIRPDQDDNEIEKQDRINEIEKVKTKVGFDYTTKKEDKYIPDCIDKYSGSL